MIMTTSAGFLAAMMAWMRGISQARALALAMGFPVSLWLLGTASIPAWVWLLPLALVVWVYPMHAWRDAPIFPTPLKALRDIPRYAILPAQAKILDAGCGAGDGLKALREAYVNAQWIGIEFSRPETMPRAVEKAKAEMKPGAWLVSLEFEAADLKANATTEASPGRPVWLYQAPFKASA